MHAATPRHYLAPIHGRTSDCSLTHVTIISFEVINVPADNSSGEGTQAVTQAFILTKAAVAVAQ